MIDEPAQLYNMDETGMPLEHRAPNIVAKKGKKKVRYRSTGNKAQITVVGCINAVGNAIPPMVIYSAKSFNADWCKCDVPGTVYALSPKGWIDQELFKHWLMSHFVKHAVSARPLLLLDGHSSHYRPDSIEYAREENIILFCLPPHTTQECQPLDVSVYRPLKMNWTDVCHEFMQENPGRVVTKFDFSGLLSKAWSRTMTPSNIINGFQKCRVYPFDPDAVKPSTSPGVLDDSSTDEDSGDGGDTGDNPEAEPVFTAEEEALFKRRFEEGFDIFDGRYHEWLNVNHPESNFSLYPHMDPEEELGDLEYMLSLADDLVAFCGESNPTDGDLSSIDPVFQLANGSSMEHFPPNISAFQSANDISLTTTTSASPTSTSDSGGDLHYSTASTSSSLNCNVELSTSLEYASTLSTSSSSPSASSTSKAPYSILSTSDSPLSALSVSKTPPSTSSVINNPSSSLVSKILPSTSTTNKSPLSAPSVNKSPPLQQASKALYLLHWSTKVLSSL